MPRMPLLAALLLLASTAVADAPHKVRFDVGGTNGVTLSGRDAVRQLLVTGVFADGSTRDLTGEAVYKTNPEGVVAIDKTGLVTPLKEGKAAVTASVGGASASTTASVANLNEDRPVSFANEVVPIFTRLGCNAGACHGKASGQNGFKLSLLGFEPDEDHEYIVKEARGRRLFPAVPARSLLLVKATGAVAHGGGKKIDEGSPFYRVLLRWIEQGAPRGGKDDASVTRIEVLPGERVLARGGRQQLAVLAHLSDGSVVDVTRMAQLEVNVPDMAEVSETGLVGVKQVLGAVAIMARYQSHVAVFRGLVPLGAAVADLPPAKNFVDELVFKQLKKLGLPPSPVTDDATLIRRATLDIAGRLPTTEEVEKYLADKDSEKYEKLIDRLLEGGDYADYFANKWGAVLRNRRKSDKDDPKPTAAFHAWIRESLHTNRPFDQFVREVLTASGTIEANPRVVWYREVRDPSAQVEDVAQLFLGQRVACAKCHHHPFEKWSQDDYYGMSAFFSQVEIIDPPPPPKPKKGEEPKPARPFEVAHKTGDAKAVNPRTNKSVKPAGLGASPLDMPDDADPRVKLADWMTDPGNPFFARTLVNRYWKHFLGRGLVEPEDDLRATNPASNPELLDALAKSFVESKHDLKKLVRTICTSRVYRLSAVPKEHNASDRQSFSRYLPKRLTAEVLLDAIDTVTLAKTKFKGVPDGTRAVQLPDNQVDSYFLGVFGRPDSASACECERSQDASLAQCLHMFNSKEMLDKVKGPRVTQIAKDKRPHEERLRELYLVALSRQPTEAELKTLLAYLEKKKDAQAAYEDVVWVLLNTKEFLFNH